VLGALQDIEATSTLGVLVVDVLFVVGAHLSRRPWS
jgi:hypothetical protein